MAIINKKLGLPLCMVGKIVVVLYCSSTPRGVVLKRSISAHAENNTNI